MFLSANAALSGSEVWNAMGAQRKVLSDPKQIYKGQNSFSAAFSVQTNILPSFAIKTSTVSSTGE